MIKKWYIGTLITAFAMLVIIQKRTIVPNHEIILEFANTAISSEDVQSSVAIIKKQLQSIGIENSRVAGKLDDGKLKISYYSDLDVEYIKNVLSKDQNVQLDHISYYSNKKDQSAPTKKDSESYTFNVCKIQKNPESGSDFNGNGILEIRQEHEGYFKIDTYPFNEIVDTDDIDSLVRETQKINTHIAIAIDNTSHNIPEVRAGPSS